MHAFSKLSKCNLHMKPYEKHKLLTQVLYIKPHFGKTELMYN